MQRAATRPWRRLVSGSLAALVCVSLTAATAVAQAPPAPDASAAPPPPVREIPRPDQLEPGVSTTPSAPEASTGNTAPQAENAKGKPQAAASSSGRKGGPARLELEATEITGNRELPKVLYIVPWKRSDLGDVVGKPVNSLLDDVLQPLDRDVFRRENRYYQALKPDQNPGRADAAQSSESKP